MAYGYNGIDFNLQPTFGRWMPRIVLGTTGAGHSIYPGVREHQIFWKLMPISDYDEIRDLYKTVSVTGTVVMSLPDIDANSYTWKNYSGCTLREPEAGQYFVEHVTDVTMMVINIQT